MSFVLKNLPALLFKLFTLGIVYCFFLPVTFSASSVEGIQVYQNALHHTLSPEHKQKLADDITRYKNAENLWDVLRREFVLHHFEDIPQVQQKIEWFMNNQDFLLRSATRAAPYLYYISQQVHKRHLPAELVLLPIIESGYNPFSLSNMGAAGIWQLMPQTASGFGIKQDWWYDGRRDIIASTRAALDYFVYLQTFFEGDWLRAIAAYNTGAGNVLAAIRKNIRDGRDTDFWSLPLSQQTRDYVPSLLALAVIISRPDLYPIYFPPVRNAPYLAQVEVGNHVNLKHAASFAGISYHQLIQLNPGFNPSSSATNGPNKLVLPIENVEQFSENFARSPFNNQINWIHYKVKFGENFASISKKFSIPVSEIRKMNHFSKNKLRSGTNILLPNKNTSIESNEVSEAIPRHNEKHDQSIIIAYKDKKSNKIVSMVNQSEQYTLQPGDTIYMVRSKDTLTKIARRFHVSTKTIQFANNLKTNYVKPGNQLVIPTHPTQISSEDQLMPGDTIYMVRRGDTIEKIANKFHTSPAAIRLENLVDNDSLNEGLQLVIPTHIRNTEEKNYG